MTTLTAATSPAAAASGQFDTVMASLPVSLERLVSAARGADLTAVDGAAGWPVLVRSAFASGTRGALVVQPVPVTDEELRGLPNAPLVLDRRFASNPALSGAAELFDSWPTTALIECRATVVHERELPGTLLDQLAVLRRLGQPIEDLETSVRYRRGHVAEGRTSGGSPVLFTTSVTTGEPPAARLRGLSADLVVELMIPDSQTARPATVVRTTSEGALQLPTVWENSHRASWRRLRDAVLYGHDTSDLHDLRADLAVSAHIFSAP